MNFQKQHATQKRNQPRFGASKDKFSDLMYSFRPSANAGFIVNDLDFIFENYLTNTIAIFEVKTRAASLSYSQAKQIPFIDALLRAGVKETGINYLGFFVLTFENSCFDDGLAWIEKPLTGQKSIVSERQFFDFIQKHF